MNEAMRDWVTNIRNTHYLVGSAIGPHPFPTIVRDFQSVIGKEARAQIIEKAGRLPDVVMACVGGGSNAIGTCCCRELDSSILLRYTEMTFINVVLLVMALRHVRNVPSVHPGQGG